MKGSKPGSKPAAAPAVVSGPRILRNGQPWPPAADPDARADNGLDRGLQFGDGLFETVHLEGGVPRIWALHWARLAQGCARLGLPQPDEHECLDDLMVVGGAGSMSAKLIWTAGTGPRGYRRPSPSVGVRWCLAGQAIADVDAHATLACVGVSTVPVSIQPHLAGIKHLNRLDQVLARQAMPSHWQEALQFDADGALVCATAANVFLHVDGAWITPSLQRAGVVGTRRTALLERARAVGTPIRVLAVSPELLARCDSLVLTSTGLGMQVVEHLEWPDAAVPRRRLTTSGPAVALLCRWFAASGAGGGAAGAAK